MCWFGFRRAIRMFWKIAKFMMCGFKHKGSRIIVPPLVIGMLIIASTANAV